MTSSRESIYGALFLALTKAVSNLGFRTISRQVRLWSEVDPADQPALFMDEKKEEAITDPRGPRGIPIKWELFVDVPVYAFGGQGPDDSAAPVINAALDAIESLFPPGGPKVQTLGIPGVSEIRIFGAIEIGQGNKSGQGIAVVPIRIVAT